VGISLITALEIFSNPNDLEISIRRERKGNGRYSIEFSRGPGHNFKLMLSSKPFTEKPEEAVEIVRETLETIQQVVAKKFADKESFLSGYFNPDGKLIDQLQVLSSDLIIQIVEELKQHQVASTYKMLATVDSQSA